MIPCAADEEGADAEDAAVGPQPANAAKSIAAVTRTAKKLFHSISLHFKIIGRNSSYCHSTNIYLKNTCVIAFFGIT